MTTATLEFHVSVGDTHMPVYFGNDVKSISLTGLLFVQEAASTIPLEFEDESRNFTLQFANVAEARLATAEIEAARFHLL